MIGVITIGGEHEGICGCFEASIEPFYFFSTHAKLVN
jgi:hypothetical protein